MSTIDRQNTSTGVSRRSALRGAAWTATAVTVVVATPNIAAASGPDATALTATTSITKGTGAVVQTLTWVLAIKNTGTTPITSITLNFGASNFAGSDGKTPPQVTSATGSWTTSTAPLPYGSATWGGTLAAGETLTVTTVWDRDKNSGGSVSASIALNGAAAPTATATFN